MATPRSRMVILTQKGYDLIIKTQLSFNPFWGRRGCKEGKIRHTRLNKPIYALLYHPWLGGFETYFVHHVAWLKDHGFESISLEDLLSYVMGKDVLVPERPIVLTFDDGTSENYAKVYPAFEKFGFSGTVFAPTAEEYLRKAGQGWWNEVEDRGVLRIEGHSHTHALAFINSEVQDFYAGKSEEARPIIKGLDERYGAPLFGLGHELVSLRFIPRRELTEGCVEYVRLRGERRFFEREKWKEEMFSLVSEYGEDLGRYETEGEKGERIAEELGVSKNIIEKTIGHGKEVRFFAYPFGAYDVDLIDCLKGMGYIGAFTTDTGGNLKGDNPYLLKRMMILAEDSFGGLGEILKVYL